MNQSVASKKPLTSMVIITWKFCVNLSCFAIEGWVFSPFWSRKHSRGPRNLFDGGDDDDDEENISLNWTKKDWILTGSYLDLIWILSGPYLDLIWILSRFYLDFIWIILDFVWILSGFYPDFIWILSGILSRGHGFFKILFF